MCREAETCELLKRHPHPNIAEYRGVVVHNGCGRIVGLCFKKYQATLMQRRRNSDAPLDVEACLSGMRRAIDHLHSIGISHNDINPGNIMFDEDDNPVLIDFDCAFYIGAKPEGSRKTGTRGWSDPDFMASPVSRKENDYFSFRKLTNFLRG